MKYTHLSQKEREQFYDLLQDGVRMKNILEILGRDPSTIYRELKRNSTSIERKYNNSPHKIKRYLPDRAQQKYEIRRKESKYSFPLKNPFVFKFTIRHLKQGWSPLIVSGRIKEKYNEQISPECIYQFIYSTRAKPLELWKYLTRSHKKRRKKYGRKGRRENIVNRTSIHQRPTTIDLRVRYGDWEGDSVLGSGKSALRTEVERLCRKVFIRKIKDKTSAETARVMVNLFSPLPKILKKSTTVDNGTEHAKHEYVTCQTGIDIYFADPYSSWQRGTNENTNGLIRRYFPKGTNFDDISEEEIQRVEDSLNNRPRRCLGYKTPNEIYNRILSTLHQTVALEN